MWTNYRTNRAFTVPLFFSSYGREEMLGLYEKGFKPPSSLSSFNSLYSEMALVPLALTPSTEDDVRTPLMSYIELNKFEYNDFTHIL